MEISPSLLLTFKLRIKKINQKIQALCIHQLGWVNSYTFSFSFEVKDPIGFDVFMCKFQTLNLEIP